MQKKHFHSSLAIVLWVMSCALVGSSAPPATQSHAPVKPLTSLGSVQGSVSISRGMNLTSPDLGRIVIWLAADPKLDSLSTSPVSATVAQKNKAFVPNFIAIAKGTSVEFPNWDRISHNVFSRSAAAPAFDLDRYPYGQSKTRVFDKVGVVQVFCNIHPFMHAIIVVTPNRFFAVSDAHGNFSIDGMPPGHYQVCAWQERCGTQSQSIDVAPADRASLSFVLSENRQDILANNPPKHDIHYGVERGLGIKRERLDLPVVTDSHPSPTTEPCAQCD